MTILTNPTIRDHTESKMYCVLYLRVSSEEQIANFSIATQEEICRREAERKGYTVIKVFTEEGKSAKDIDGRPQLIELLEYCRKHKLDIAAVIVYRIDRMSRSTQDYLAIRKTLANYGVVILSATEPTGASPTEQMLETILASFGELDNNIRAERARNGLHKRFLSGQAPSAVPLGYTHFTQDNKRLIIKDEILFPKVKMAWELMATGTKTLSEIASVMNTWGIRVKWKKREREIDKQYASKLFKNSFYYGLLPSRKYKEKVQGTHEPMITEEQFYRVQAVISGRSNQTMVNSHNRDNESFPLRGLITCGVCGRPYTGGMSKGKNKKYAYYFCPKGCKGSVIAPENERKDGLHDQLIQKLREITPTDEALAWFKIKLHAAYNSRLKLLEERYKSAQRRIDDLKTKYNLLVEKNMSGLYSDEVFKEQSKKIEEELTVAHLVKNEDKISKYNIEEIVNFTSALLADLGRAFELSTLSQKRMLLGSIYTEKPIIENKTIRTPELSPLFALMHQLSTGYVNSSAQEYPQFEHLVDTLYSLHTAYPNYRHQFV